MKIKQIILSIIFSFSIFSTHSTYSALLSEESIITLQKNAKEWIENHISPLSPQEVQVAANLLYFLKANAVVEKKIRSKLPKIIGQAWTIRKRILAYETCAEESELHQILTCNIAKLNTKRRILFQKLQKCEDFVTMQSSDALLSACEQLQIAGEQQLFNYVFEYKKTIKDDLKTNIKQYYDASEYLRSAGKFLKGLVTGFSSKKKNNELEKIRHIEVATQVADQVTTQSTALHTQLPINNVHLFNLIDISKAVYSIYYQAIYNYILQKFDPKFRTIIFDQHGMISDDQKREALPLPKNLDILEAKYL